MDTSGPTEMSHVFLKVTKGIIMRDVGVLICKSPHYQYMYYTQYTWL